MTKNVRTRRLPAPVSTQPKQAKSTIDSSLISAEEMDKVKERIKLEKTEAETLSTLKSLPMNRDRKARLGLMRRTRERSVEIDENIFKTIVAHKKQNERAAESGGCVDLPGLAVLVEKMRSGQDHFVESFSRLGANFQKQALSRLFQKSRESNTEAHTNMVRKLCSSRNVRRVKGDKDWNVVSGEYNSVRYYAYRHRHSDPMTGRAVRYSVVMSVHRSDESENDTSLGLSSRDLKKKEKKRSKKSKKRNKKKGKKSKSKEQSFEKSNEDKDTKQTAVVKKRKTLDERLIFAVIQRDEYDSGMIVFTILETLQNVELAHMLLKNLQLAEISARFTIAQCQYNDLMNDIMDLEDEIHVLGSGKLGENIATPNGDSMTSFRLNGALDHDHDKHSDLLQSVFVISSESQNILKRIGTALMAAKKEQKRQSEIVDAKRREIESSGTCDDDAEFIEVS